MTSPSHRCITTSHSAIEAGAGLLVRYSGTIAVVVRAGVTVTVTDKINVLLELSARSVLAVAAEEFEGKEIAEMEIRYEKMGDWRIVFRRTSLVLDFELGFYWV